jgi:hypothetical protein
MVGWRFILSIGGCVIDHLQNPLYQENNMSASRDKDNIQITIGDDAQNLAVGKNIHQNINTNPKSQVTEEDIKTVQEKIDYLKNRIATEAPAEKKGAAIERVEELEKAIIEKPDLTTIEYVKNWIGKNLPQLAGTVTSIIVNPIVGKVVEAAGDITAKELKKRFGNN